MSDKSNDSADRGQGEQVGKALEEARGGVVLPIQTAPVDITNHVGGLPPAGDSSAGGNAPGSSGSGEE